MLRRDEEAVSTLGWHHGQARPDDAGPTLPYVPPSPNPAQTVIVEDLIFNAKTVLLLSLTSVQLSLDGGLLPQPSGPTPLSPSP